MVSLDRIAAFLAEDEVTDQVSSLKKSGVGLAALDGDDERLGIKNGSFKWNEVEDGVKDDSDSATVTDDSDTAVTSDTDGQSTGDHRFELKDINVIFPEGKLTLITGPTASGKTALLVGSNLR